MDLPSREAAWSLLEEHTQGEGLRKHALAVEIAMRAYATKFGDDPDLWGLAGLLHDFDYEQHPSPEEHPAFGAEILRKREYPELLVRAILSHAPYTGVERVTPMEKSLFAVDELCGFLMACAYMRPQGIHGMTPKSVKKKMKTPAFAAAIDRDALRSGAEDLGVDFDEHVALVIAALEEHADELELNGAEAA